MQSANGNKYEKKSIRVIDEDYLEYLKLKQVTGVPLCQLLHFAIPLLKKKYKITEQVRNDDKL